MNERSARCLGSVLAVVLAIAVAGVPADAIAQEKVFCGKKDKDDPTKVKEKSKITVKDECDPSKELEIKLKEKLASCGDGFIDGKEECDTNNLDGETCASLGYTGGKLACLDCSFNKSACYDERFVANADGTITDNETCLMWEKKTGAVAGIQVACGMTDCPDVHHVMNTYRYCVDEAPFDFACDIPGNLPDGPLFLSFLNRLNGTDGACFAGYCDWRIPTVGELMGVLDGSSCPNGDPCTAWDNADTAFGPTSTAYVHRMSSTTAANLANAWIVYGTPGDTSFNASKAGLGGHARAVRTIPGCK